jgi:hypothetical protein
MSMIGALRAIAHTAASPARAKSIDRPFDIAYKFSSVFIVSSTNLRGFPS